MVREREREREVQTVSSFLTGTKREREKNGERKRERERLSTPARSGNGWCQVAVILPSLSVSFLHWKKSF